MPKPITSDLVYKLTTLSEPTISPDGTRLAFASSKIDRDRMKAASRIMMMSLPDGEPSPFTQGETDGSPRFSPDGNAIAFVRNDDHGRKQLWTIPSAGGEANRLTDVYGGIYGHAWSPDARQLAFTSDVDPDRLPDDHDPTKDPRVRVVQRMRYRTDNMGWRGETIRHLFVVDVETGHTRQITDRNGDVSFPVWSPDGGRIAFLSDRHQDRDITWHAEAYVVDSQGGESEEWSRGVSAYSQGAIVGAITWSPRGDELLMVGSDDDEVSDPRQAWLFVVGPGRQPKRLTDGSVTPFLPTTELRWTQDDRILFLADERGQSYLGEVPAKGGDVRKVAGGGAAFTALTIDAATSTAVVAGTTPNSSTELFVIAVEQGSLRKLTDVNSQYFSGHPAATLEKFTVSRGAMEIESRLLLPPDLDETQKHPLVVDIHGGPHGRFADSFDDKQQVLATAGFIVLAVNPRGSSSYGPEFAKAVLRDWGGEDYRDIIAAVDEACSRPYVDESRLGVGGYSYGGFMSSWIVGQTTRFKAAVVGAPCINLSSMYGTSDIGVSFGELHWGGMRKDAVDAFRAHSPLTYASNVETPVLLMHGEGDLRCPIEQSEQYFVNLKRLGKEVEFVRFPGANHTFMRSGHPRLREEYLTRMVAWFDRHLRG